MEAKKEAKKDKPIYSNVNMTQDDFVAQGFRKLDDHLIAKRPPKINWGERYRQSPPKVQIQYLEKLASTMNNAAYLIQGERNELGNLCEKKEGQIIQLSKAMDDNTKMLQSEMTKINEERQRFNSAIAERNTEIRELKKKIEELQAVNT